MTGPEYIPVRRLDQPPPAYRPFTRPEQRELAVRRTLRGVELGAHDVMVIDRLVDNLGEATLRTLLSLVERARLAALGEHVTEDRLMCEERVAEILSSARREYIDGRPAGHPAASAPANTASRWQARRVLAYLQGQSLEGARP